MSRFPFLFTVISNLVRVLLSAGVFSVKLLIGLRNLFKCKPFGNNRVKVTTSFLKFNSVKEGYYGRKNDEIILNFSKKKKIS
jgi:hypothetical protein